MIRTAYCLIFYMLDMLKFHTSLFCSFFFVNEFLPVMAETMLMHDYLCITAEENFTRLFSLSSLFVFVARISLTHGRFYEIHMICASVACLTQCPCFTYQLALSLWSFLSCLHISNFIWTYHALLLQSTFYVIVGSENF